MADARTTSPSVAPSSPTGIDAVRRELNAVQDLAGRISGEEQGSPADFLMEILMRDIMPRVKADLASVDPRIAGHEMLHMLALLKAAPPVCAVSTSEIAIGVTLKHAEQAKVAIGRLVGAEPEASTEPEPEWQPDAERLFIATCAIGDVMKITHAISRISGSNPDERGSLFGAVEVRLNQLHSVVMSAISDSVESTESLRSRFEGKNRGVAA